MSRSIKNKRKFMYQSRVQIRSETIKLIQPMQNKNKFFYTGIGLVILWICLLIGLLFIVDAIIFLINN